MKFLEFMLMLIGALALFGIGVVVGYILQVAKKKYMSKPKKLTGMALELSEASQRTFDLKVKEYVKNIKSRINQSVEQGLFWVQVIGSDNADAFREAVKTFEKQGLGVEYVNEDGGVVNLSWGKGKPKERKAADIVNELANDYGKRLDSVILPPVRTKYTNELVDELANGDDLDREVLRRIMTR